MILLEGGAMSLITPDPGLFIWSVLIFIILWVVLGKFAFKPIVKALSQRNKDIQRALDSAEEAKAEMATLKAQNDEILNQAKAERAEILKEAGKVKDQIIAEAKENAKVEASKIMTDAKREIDSQKASMMVEVKNSSAALAIEIAEKVLGKELNDKKSQESLAQTLAKEANLN